MQRCLSCHCCQIRPTVSMTAAGNAVQVHARVQLFSVCVCVCTCVRVYVCVCAYVCVRVRMKVRLVVSAYVIFSMHIHVIVCAAIFMAILPAQS